ncbi:O-antigen ligase family protein [Stenotrophobium rhamnosiphilum]|nr:O-antigen ligase family protein [Stenotrophobium rhamnosiphilum]
MNPLSGVRLLESMSYGDFFFALAGVIALCERGFNRERIYFYAIYLGIAILITLSFLVNKFMPEPMKAAEYIEFIHTFINNHFRIEFGQFPNFRVIFAALIIFPQVFLALRIKTMGEARVLTYFWLAGAIYGALFTVLYCMGWIPGHVDAHWITFHRSKGLTGHPNALALNTAIAFPILVLLFMERKEILLRLFVLVAAFLMWRTIGYAGSRTAIYALMAMALAIFILMYHELPHRARFNLMAIGFIVVSYFVVQKYIIGLDGSTSVFRRLESGSAVSDAIRAHDREIALTGFANSPFFGAGYQWLYTAHNMYLQVLHASGIVGFTGYVLAMLFPPYLAWQSRFLRASNSGRLHRNVLLVCAFGVIVSGWAQPNINALNPTIPFGLLLCLGVIHLGKMKQDAQQAVPLSAKPVGL